MKLTFNQLPSQLQERLLWEMDLDYDSYESSMAEEIHNTLNGRASLTNERIINTYCTALSDEVLKEHIAILRGQLSQQINSLDNLTVLLNVVK